MSRIRILPEIISNKIAAGEVIERPASVVKELLENAIDAGSSRILIDIEKGGRRLIEVVDNGIGMDQDDCLLALERYATSKIRTDPDLFAIQTLGFRGEALPSIASVARVTVVSRTPDAAAATRVEVEGGKILSVKAHGAPAGTMIRVADLFFNTPARRKFLKTISTEMGHIADMVSRMALSRPDVHFILRHNQRELKNWPAAANPVDRVADVLGMALRAELHRLEGSVAEVSVEGWLSSSRYTRRTASAIYQFVNGRPVKDRLIMHALLEGYHGRLMKGLFPVAVLRLKVPFDQVDVNVHPAKNEVRFLDARKVHQAIRTLVRQTLLTADQSELGSTPSSNRPALPDRSLQPTVFNPPSLAEATERFQASAQQVDKPAVTWSQSSRMPAPLSNAPDPEPTRQSPLWQDKPFSSLRVIGQIHNTYIVCESPEGVILIDQHAAHERILFEQLRAQKHAAKPLAQNLLMPETVELSLKEADLLNAHLDLLQRLGFHIEPFGGDTYIVKAVPAVLAGGAVEPLLRELLENWELAGGRSAAAEIMDASLKTMACHTALRAREDLTGAEIKALLQQLDACRNPSHCPHGRPTWIRWTSQALQKAFHRIV